MEPDEELLAQAEADFLAEARASLGRNYTAHLLHGLFGQTGFRLIQAPTFIPAYLYLLSGSELVVGLARGAQSLGHMLTPLFGATLIEHRTRVLPLGFLFGALMRIQLLGIALAGFFLAPEAATVATVLFLTLFGLFQGIQGVLFNVLRSKVIPVEVRGRLAGIRNFLAGTTAAAVAGLGGYFVAEGTLGNGYATTFLVGFAFTMLGLLMLTLMREPASPRVRERQNLVGRLADLPALLRGDRDFTAFFLVRALATMGRMGVPYYIVYSERTLGFTSEALGPLTIAWMVATMGGHLVWGWMGDRTGFRGVLLIALAIWIAAVAALLSISEFAGLLAVFAGVGLGQSGFQMASQNLVLEFGSRENLPLRIGVANTAAEAIGAIGPVLGGVLAVTYSLEPVFYLAIGFQVVAWLAMLVFVRDPRFSRTGSSV